MDKTYYEFDITYNGKKVDRILIPGNSEAGAWDNVSQEATDRTKIKLVRIIGPDDCLTPKGKI